MSSETVYQLAQTATPEELLWAGILAALAEGVRKPDLLRWVAQQISCADFEDPELN